MRDVTPELLPTTHRLSGGAELTAVTTDRFKTGSLTVSTVLPVDRRNSPLDNLLFSVLSRATATHPTLREMNRHMDLLYDLTLFDRNLRMGDLQILGNGIHFLDPAYLPASEDARAIGEENVQMLVDSLYAPLYAEDGCFRADYVELERTNQCDGIRDEKNNPGTYAEKRCRELTFPDSPYGTPLYGTVEAVSAFTARELTDRYAALLPHAALRFFYVGSQTGEQMAETLDRALCDSAGRPFTDGTLRTAVPPLSVPGDPGVPCRFEETLPVSQGRLEMILSAGADLRSEELFTAMVYNELLGASPTSKLFMNVREKQSLCYSCYSAYDFYKGCISVSAGIRCDNRERAEEEILRQIGELRLGHITRSELDGAIRYLQMLYTGLYDSPSGIEKYFFSRSIYGVSCPPSELRKRIAAVTVEDVTRYAQRVYPLSVYFLRGTRPGRAGEEDADESEF